MMTALAWLWLSWLAPAAEPSTDCAGCHVAEATAHARSRHAIAWTNELFRGEYDPHPKAWCVSCHAPEVPEVLRMAPEAVPALADRGVSCRTCHVRAGRVRSREVSGRAPHASVADPTLGTAADCAGCHQFAFPRLDAAGEIIGTTTVPMQDTVAQHRRSGTEIECSGCHAPDHSMPGSHSTAMLARSLEVEPCRSASGMLRVSVRNRGASHHVPSGGVHRHIAIELWRSAAPAALHRVQLGRWFRDRPGGGKTAVADTTIAAGQVRRIEIDPRALGGAPSAPVNLAVRYVYASPEAPLARAGRAGTRTFVNRQFELGELPPCSR